MKAYLAMWRETPHLAALFTLIGMGWLAAGLLFLTMIYDLLTGEVTSP